jgi:C1A family cysteine protease
LHVVAPTEISVGVSCSAEIGSSMIADQLFTGDQIGSSGCPAPSAGGILANFNWLDKNQLTCVKNQGHRGLCHIFAATSAMEEKIAHDTGNHVNLSEQDFTEHETLIWNNSNFNDAGHAYNDLQDAAANNYQFAYEYQWDYNPSGVSAPSRL